jgi:hypothetical protein
MPVLAYLGLRGEQTSGAERRARASRQLYDLGDSAIVLLLEGPWNDTTLRTAVAGDRHTEFARATCPTSVPNGPRSASSR